MLLFEPLIVRLLLCQCTEPLDQSQLRVIHFQLYWPPIKLFLFDYVFKRPMITTPLLLIYEYMAIMCLLLCMTSLNNIISYSVMIKVLSYSWLVFRLRYALISTQWLVTLVPCVLTLSVRGPSYYGLVRTISWLLMPWLLTSPGHQQLWYWLCRICRSWYYLRKDFKYMCLIDME